MHAPAGLSQPDSPFDAAGASLGIRVAAGVARVEQRFKNVCVGYGSMRDGDLTDQFATLVDAGVQLIADVIFTMLFAPLGVDVFWGVLVRLSAQHHDFLLIVSALSRLLRWTGACTIKV